MHRQCLNHPLETGYDCALYLALRRGLLMVEAQSAWLVKWAAFCQPANSPVNQRTTPPGGGSGRLKRRLAERYIES
jgi:hypothetical protein